MDAKFAKVNFKTVQSLLITVNSITRLPNIYVIHCNYITRSTHFLSPALFMGGVVGVAGEFNNWEFAAYAMYPCSGGFDILFFIKYHEQSSADMTEQDIYCGAKILWFAPLLLAICSSEYHVCATQDLIQTLVY